ncbi:Type 2A phosphatase-associated protein 42 [Rhizina undulata]
MEENDSNSSDSSLRTLYNSAEAFRKDLEATYGVSSEFQDKVQNSLAAYRKCKDLVERLSLFSLNETIEDVSSSELRYLLIDFYIAELGQKDTALPRKTVLERSRSDYKRFLILCEAYELLSASDKATLEHLLDPSSSPVTLPSDPAMRRNAIIARYKQEKELKAKVEFLSSHESAADDADTRTLYLSAISLAVMQTVQALDMISRELDILSKAPPPETIVPSRPDEDERSRQPEFSKDQYSDKLDFVTGDIKGGPLLNKDGKPLRPFTLLDSRERLKKQVFGPGHNLPTMTIDEYLEEERRRGGIIEGGGEKSGIRPEPDEDDYEKADAETYKAREWDEFKEANPRHLPPFYIFSSCLI